MNVPTKEFLFFLFAFEMCCRVLDLGEIYFPTLKTTSLLALDPHPCLTRLAHTHMHDIHKRCRQTFEIHKYPYLCVSIYVRAHVEYVHVDTVYAFAHVINARKTHTHIYIYIYAQTYASYAVVICAFMAIRSKHGASRDACTRLPSD